MNKTSEPMKYLLTGAVVLIAVAAVALKYWDYLANPWTRDGQVRAQVIQITPRVSGPIVDLPIKDNQLVKTGDVLFRIDPRTFQAAVDEARAALDQAKSEAENAREEVDRDRAIMKRDAGAVSKQILERKENAQRQAESAVEGAQAKLTAAELDLEFTQVTAPVDGYVTNLNLRLGSQAVANQPALALIDINSFWVHGYFRENHIAGIGAGDRAVVTLMSYPDRPLQGQVDSLGWGIAQEDGSTGESLLPNVSPSFEWIRLAQRVPVRVHLTEVPDDVQLRVGTTASVLVMKGTAGTESRSTLPPAPSFLR
jgi:multidrug resistance efflux pump